MLLKNSLRKKLILAKTSIGNIERDENEVAITTLHKIASTLNAKTSELVRDAEY
jgi:DNA-binding XRE family transcriptional regulator